MRILYCCLVILFFFGSGCVPIETPDQPERNQYVINAPSGWGYRTFKGTNGLIGVLWPERTSFSDSKTAVFVFTQNLDEVFLPPQPENNQLFHEKCPKSEFRFTSIEEDGNKTLSIEEKYFAGFCGRTEILFEEKVKNIRIITLVASSFYISPKMFKDIKYIVSAYREEVKSALKIGKKQPLHYFNNSFIYDAPASSSRQKEIIPQTSYEHVDPLENITVVRSLQQQPTEANSFQNIY